MKFWTRQAVAGTLHNVLHGDLNVGFHVSLLENEELLTRVAKHNAKVNAEKYKVTENSYQSNARVDSGKRNLMQPKPRKNIYLLSQVRSARTVYLVPHRFQNIFHPYRRRILLRSGPGWTNFPGGVKVFDKMSCYYSFIEIFYRYFRFNKADIDTPPLSAVIYHPSLSRWL